jgi:hypothetical protein
VTADSVRAASNTPQGHPYGVERQCLELEGVGVVGSVQSSKDRGEWVLVAGLRASHVVQVALVMAM